MAVIEITSAEQFEEILGKNPKLSEQFKDIVFVSVDVDKVPAVAQKYSVRAMPTFMMFKDGEKCDDIMGANKVGLEDKIKVFAA